MKYKKMLCAACIALGISLMIAGVATKDYENVFRKAALICYECIGIG
ncbi:MAG: hypothetical protein MJ071_07230 [Oscillospiraceae bacterium]|nr:hypothetical protein [Oscillospiraceae bacterium]